MSRHGVRREPRMIRLIESSSAQVRLEHARAFVDAHAADGDVTLVGASRGAVDDLARSIAAMKGATIGLHRFSLTQLAARLAAPVLAAQGLAPGAAPAPGAGGARAAVRGPGAPGPPQLAPVTALASEAVAARATFEARRASALRYFEPVAGTPGFPRALARTIQELRLAHVEGRRLNGLPLGGADLAVLLDRFEEQFAAS